MNKLRVTQRTGNYIKVKCKPLLRKKQRNWNTYFYRFECQNRGTIHLHLLVWLKNPNELDLNRFKWTMEEKNPSIGYHVTMIVHILMFN